MPDSVSLSCISLSNDSTESAATADDSMYADVKRLAKMPKMYLISLMIVP